MDKLPTPCRCGQEPVVWMHDGIVLIQCQDPHCRNIEIVGQQTHRMAVQAWDEHQEQAAEIARLRAENTVLRDTLVKANELHEKTIAGSAENERAWTAELARLRAALAEADRERDEAARKIREHAEHVNYYGNLYSKTEVERRKLDEQREFYKDELAKAQVCADEMAALAWKWKYKADCQRETIRALVVAARALRQAGWNWRGGRVTTDFMVLDVRARVAQIRLQEKLNSEQAGKE